MRWRRCWAAGWSYRQETRRLVLRRVPRDLAEGVRYVRRRPGDRRGAGGDDRDEPAGVSVCRAGGADRAAGVSGVAGAGGRAGGVGSVRGIPGGRGADDAGAGAERAGADGRRVGAVPGVCGGDAAGAVVLDRVPVAGGGRVRVGGVRQYADVADRAACAGADPVAADGAADGVYRDGAAGDSADGIGSGFCRADGGDRPRGLSGLVAVCAIGMVWRRRERR